MKLFFVTGNKHKFEEAKSVFFEYNIDIGQIDDEKYEPKDMDLKQVSIYNAKLFHKKYNKPVIVDDTGVFFRAYPNFPGNHPKLMFELLGYKGLLKLLEDENKEAMFRTVVTYADDKIVKSFEGVLECTADIKINDMDKDVLAYERILLYKGKPISSMSREDKNMISHRAKAFREMGKWMANKGVA